MTRKRLSITAIVVLALVVLVLARCQQEEDEEVEFPDPEYSVREPLPAAQERPEVEIRPGQAIVEGQIVLTGESESIGMLLDNLPDGLELEHLVTTNFTFLGNKPPPVDEEQDNRQQSSGKRQRAIGPQLGLVQDLPSLEIALFGIVGGEPTVSEALELLAPVVLGSELQGTVIAEPNYVTGFEITGSPWGVEGSPWGVEGSPWGVEGSPDSDAEPSPGSAYAGNKFWLQWALRGRAGINLLNGSAPFEGRPSTQTGFLSDEDQTIEEKDRKRVQVVVFDTSPFEDEGQYIFTNWAPPDDDIEPLTLTAYHPLTLPQSLTPTESTTNTVDISDHGLFVSGLVYAVAPDSNLTLIQVLNNQGQGELQALIDAMSVYMLRRLDRDMDDDDSLEDTVINFSLGAHAPSSDELSDEARGLIMETLAIWDLEIPQDGPFPVGAMSVMMELFDMYGATVVAASGNHSAQVEEPLPPQYPAAFSTVLGVTASNLREDSSDNPIQSCYANDGDLMAPGGDGYVGDKEPDGPDGIVDATPTPPADPEDFCLPTHTTCAKKGPNCGYGVVSYTWNEPSRGFAYWVGTSFATPLVSGLAANLIQAGATSPTQVRGTLLCTGAGNSVVDAESAVDLVMSSTALTNSNCPPQP